MAGQRLTDKTALSENLANDDLLMCVDTSDNTGSSVGTSKKVENKYIIQTDIKTGNLDLATSPLTLVDAPGTGFFIQPITISIIYLFNSVASNVSNYLYVSYDSSSTLEFLVRHRDFIRNDTGDRSYVFGAGGSSPADGTYKGNMEDRSLRLYTNADLNGNGSFKVYVTYQIVSV